MRWPWTRGARERSAREQLEGSLQEVRLLLQQAYAGFNTATDSELVESYIYEIQALQARYSYLLRQRKALGGPTAGRTGRRARAQSALPVA